VNGSNVSRVLEKFVRLRTHGNVDRELVKRLLDVIVECYERLGPPLTHPVELNVYERSEGPGFFASHDALHGKPRIKIYLDRVSALPWKVVIGGVRRQAAHSILHGSIEYYRVSFPVELRRAMENYGLPERFAVQILYGASMAVKEYNVTRLLVDGGFVDDQLAYSKYMLEPTAEELRAWQIAKSNPLARIIYLVMTIRDIFCAVPLLEDSKLRGEIERCFEKRIKHLSANYESTVRGIVNEVVQRFTEDVFQNIDILTNAIVKYIIKKELTSQ